MMRDNGRRSTKCLVDRRERRRGSRSGGWRRDSIHRNMRGRSRREGKRGHGCMSLHTHLLQSHKHLTLQTHLMPKASVAVMWVSLSHYRELFEGHVKEGDGGEDRVVVGDLFACVCVCVSVSERETKRYESNLKIK